ncbi:HTH_Tnp_Tc3_2 domain-containing protein [Trichonephila clavipes]|nr:HTH_Tnp_Tc3_2 domain-containing protein [Trichonephila clavipes]
MPGKRARRHFSQLSEFERGLIIGMKTAGWSTRRVAGQVDRSECAVRNCWDSGHEKVPTRGKPGLERPGRPREERPLAEANFKSKRPFRALPLNRNIGNCVYSGAKPDQCGMSQIGKRMCLVMNPGLFREQMITVYGCGGALVSGTIPPTLFYVSLPTQLL